MHMKYKSFFKRHPIAMNSIYFVLVNSCGFVFFIHWRMQDFTRFCWPWICGLHPGAYILHTLHPSGGPWDWKHVLLFHLFILTTKNSNWDKHYYTNECIMQTHSAFNYSVKWVNKEMKLECTANSVFIVDFHMITPLLRKPSSVPGEAFIMRRAHDVRVDRRDY